MNFHFAHIAAYYSHLAVNAESPEMKTFYRALVAGIKLICR